MKTRQPLRIMFAGASGTGKTTMAKFISKIMGDGEEKVPFVSGSISDLLPQTKDIPHQDMLARDSKDLMMEDYQVLNLRNKLYQPYVEEEQSFVSDRSFLDLGAYFLYKQADKLPPCEIDAFLSLCKQCLTKQCTHLIFLPFNMEMFQEWVTENNGKRITSRYFQMEISLIMNMVLDIFKYESNGHLENINYGFFNSKSFNKGMSYGKIESPYGVTKVFIIHEVNITNREDLIQYILTR